MECGWGESDGSGDGANRRGTVRFDRTLPSSYHPSGRMRGQSLL